MSKFERFFPYCTVKRNLARLRYDVYFEDELLLWFKEELLVGKTEKEQERFVAEIGRRLTASTGFKVKVEEANIRKMVERLKRVK